MSALARQRHIIIMPIMMIAARPLLSRMICASTKTCRHSAGVRAAAMAVTVHAHHDHDYRAVTPTLNLKCRYNSDSGSESEST